ncbi:MAG: cytochrome c [Limnobacter sp.]|nr:cytochrome c [Limnobacter sp.]
MSQKLLIAAGLLALAAPFAAQSQGNPEAARDKISMCVGCHEIPGYKTAFPVVYSVPMIYGQSAKYLEAALQAYRKGDRSHPSMRAIAGSLTDQDIADLAAYYGTN